MNDFLTFDKDLCQEFGITRDMDLPWESEEFGEGNSYSKKEFLENQIKALKSQIFQHRCFIYLNLNTPADSDEAKLGRSQAINKFRGELEGFTAQLKTALAIYDALEARS